MCSRERSALASLEPRVCVGDQSVSLMVSMNNDRAKHLGLISLLGGNSVGSCKVVILLPGHKARRTRCLQFRDLKPQS